MKTIKDIVILLGRIEKSLENKDNDDLIKEFNKKRYNILLSIINHFNISKKDAAKPKEVKLKKVLDAPIPEKIYINFVQLESWWSSIKDENHEIIGVQ